MKKFWIIILLASLSLGSCVKVSQETATAAPVLFVTSTLPPTKPALSLPTPIPPTGTPDASTTITPGGTASTSPASCKDSAILIEDVTYPDNTRVPAGQKFTKTWKLQNVGTCTWTGYKIAFSSGDRMNSPDTAPVPETAAKSTVDVSIDLTAPSVDGLYRGNYELRNAKDEIVSIGIEKVFWVQIIVGSIPTPGTPSGSGGTSTSGGSLNCIYSRNAGYVSQIQTLINDARSAKGLPALTINTQLTDAAQGHAADMACNNFLSHTGSNGSSAYTRFLAAGYNPSYTEEIIYGGGGPEVAFNWWMNDQVHRDAILNPKATEMGIGYAFTSTSNYGDYFAVDFGSP
jgi:uncharacterized protein YkwD